MPASLECDNYPAASSALLNYESQLVEELLDEDKLCILAGGLGWHRIVAVFLRLHYHQQQGVVLVLGCQPWQRTLLCHELRRHDAAATPPMEISAEVPSAERVRLYQSRTCCFVTTRILVVDFLNRRVLPSQISGMIVVNAHKVTDTSGEGFAVRLYRAGNRDGFLRAFSDQPSNFVTGFNKVEKVMKALHVRRLCLWPRFQQSTVDELSRNEAEVVSWEQELSGSMQLIQTALVEVLDSLLKELRRVNKIDCSDLRLEDGLSTALDEKVKRQLDPIWHTVGWKTRQIVRDLRTLREVAHVLIHHDAIRFLKYLESLRLSESRSVWLFHDATHTIFDQARRRVYLIVPGHHGAAVPPADTAARPTEGSATRAAGARKRKQPSAPASGSTAVAGAGGSDTSVAPVLEELPKWDLLHDVVEEIQAERSRLRSLPMEPTDSAIAVADGGSAVAMADDDPKQPLPGSTSGGAALAPPSIGSHGGPAPPGDAVVIEDDDDDADLCDAAVAGGSQDAALDADALKVLRETGHCSVLIVARELHMCGQLLAILRDGAPAVMREMYEAYVVGKMAPRKGRGAAGDGVEQGSAVAERGGRGGGRGGRQATAGKRARGGQGGRDGPGELHGVFGRGPNMQPGEYLALQAEANRLAGLDKHTGSGKGQRGRGARGGGRTGRARRRDDSPPPPLAEAQNASPDGAQESEAQQRSGGVASTSAAASTRAAAAAAGGSSSAPAAATSPLLRDVHFHSLDSHDDYVLWRVQPAFIVLFDSDLSFMRQIEVYKASFRAGQPLRVYQLMYSESLEKAKYMAAVQREVSAFTQLIEFKQHIVIPIDITSPAQQLVARGAVEGFEMRMDVAGGGSYNALTRVAGGVVAPRGLGPRALPRRVVVDVREFMSSLPCVLHQQGFELVPVTLEVGDYVLSPEMCVERKAIPDLISSFASGRLYHQAEAMCRHYKTPILLLEFDPDKAFSLQSGADLGDDIDQRSLLSRLVLLLLHFPKMRLIWSRSLHATGDSFMALKSNQDEPDPAAAALIGVPTAVDGALAGGTGGVETMVNTAAMEMLRRLPGVTDVNYRNIIAAVGSLAELADTPLDRLETIMGSNKNAKMLRDFLDASAPQLG